MKLQNKIVHFANRENNIYLLVCVRLIFNYRQKYVYLFVSLYYSDTVLIVKLQIHNINIIIFNSVF